MTGNLHSAGGREHRPIIDMRQCEGDRRELLNLVECIYGRAGGRLMTMVEIGSYQGQSMEIFASTGRLARIVCVDPWLGRYDEKDEASFTDMREVERRFDVRAENAKKRCDIIKHKGTIDTLVRSDDYRFAADADFVYIDGLHTYDGCRHDIETVKKYIKPKLAFAGHDYCDGWIGVKTAVNELLGIPDKVYTFTSWIKFIASTPRKGNHLQ